VTRIVPISNECRDYAWGQPGGISKVLGGPATDAREAELWLGAHPGSPCSTDDERWETLQDWEEQTGQQLPYLLKVLAAAQPLSLQAHPSSDRAERGYALEEERGVPRDAPHRSYKDPHAKPELILALEDGFEALCGFRPLADTRADVAALRELADDPEPYARWAGLLEDEDPLRQALAWLLSDEEDAHEVATTLAATAGRDPERFASTLRLCEDYAGDSGVAVALMLNHVTLAAGECLWLPAGNIHAYIEGVGIELMGPSDNVLRGGMTPKHVDVPELISVLDFSDGEPPWLAPEAEGETVSRYRPASVESGADVPFELRQVTGDATVATGSPAIVLVVDGEYAVSEGGESRTVGRGEAVFVPDAGELRLTGTGRAYVASA
jgi:mannose-6-phosphate isomerase